MCFTLGQSAAMTSIATLAAIALYVTKKPFKYIVILAYFAAMEGLQVLQYLVADDCSSKTNQLLTYLGWVHMAFQPFVANWVLFAPPYPAGLSRLEPPFTYPVIHKIVKRLSLAAAACILIKAIPSLVALLGAQQLLSDALAPHLPDRVLSTLLTNTCEGSSELMCGAKLCCMTGKYHLAWVAPQMGTGYYVTSFAMHGFAMFVPSLLFGSTHHKLIILLLFVSGPLMSEVLVWGGGQAVRRLEWPSIWCLFSVAQVVTVLGIETISNGLVHGRWTLDAVDDAGVNGVANGIANGFANGVHHAGAGAKKEL